MLNNNFVNSNGAVVQCTKTITALASGIQVNGLESRPGWPDLCGFGLRHRQRHYVGPTP